MLMGSLFHCLGFCWSLCGFGFVLLLVLGFFFPLKKAFVALLCVLLVFVFFALARLEASH